jgi:hypothetical protein
MNPLAIKKMLDNLKPLSTGIAKACLTAWERVAWERSQTIV